MGEIAPVQSKDLLNALTVRGDVPWCNLSDLGWACYFAGGNRPTGSSPSSANGFQNIFDCIVVIWIISYFTCLIMAI